MTRTTQWHDPRFSLAGVVNAGVLAKRLAKRVKRSLKARQEAEMEMAAVVPEQTLLEQLKAHQDLEHSHRASRGNWG